MCWGQNATSAKTIHLKTSIEDSHYIIILTTYFMIWKTSIAQALFIVSEINKMETLMQK